MRHPPRLRKGRLPNEIVQIRSTPTATKASRSGVPPPPRRRPDPEYPVLNPAPHSAAGTRNEDMRHRAQRQKAHRGTSAYGGKMKTGEGLLRRRRTPYWIPKGQHG